MSKWSRLKVALLVTVGMLAAWGSCLPSNWWQKVQQYVVIGNLFD